MSFTQPLISVDVVPLQYDPAAETVLVVLGERIYEPFLGELALPGVLLQHELVREAASRALAQKVGVGPDSAAAITDIGVFDNPDRDPRGPTLSLAHLAALPAGTPVGDKARKIPLDEVAGLPFDHASIITAGAHTLLRALWNDREITRAVLGDPFSSRDAGLVQRSLMRATSGDEKDLNSSNLGRRIAGSEWVTRLPSVGSSAATGGRPPALWGWQ